MTPSMASLLLVAFSVIRVGRDWRRGEALVPECECDHHVMLMLVPFNNQIKSGCNLELLACYALKG